MSGIVDLAGRQLVQPPFEAMGQDDVHVMLMRGGAPSKTTPMLWDTQDEKINAHHAASPPSADVDYWLASNVKVSGAGAMVSRGENYLFAPTIFPKYVRHFIEHDINSEFWRHPECSKATRLDSAISILNFNLIYGHWLLEMFPKILMLKYMLPHLRNVPLLIPSTAPAYVEEIITTTLGNWPIYKYDRFNEHVEVDLLTLPGSFQSEYIFHPHLAALLDRYVEEQTARYRWFRRQGRRTRIFVSRANVSSSFRSLKNAAELEAIAKARGLTIIHPENLPWARQLDAFNRAAVIVGEFGSGMHNALFSRKDTKVVCLNWISEVQSRIANYRGHRVGYILPSDGISRVFDLEGKFHEYHIDPDEFRSTLDSVLD